VVAAHQAQQAPVSAPLGIVLLPELEEVLIDQPNDVEAVGHDQGIGEVLSRDRAIGFRQIHDDDADMLTTWQTFEVAAQTGLRSPQHDIEHLVVLQINQRSGVALLASEEVFIDIQDPASMWNPLQWIGR